MIRKLPGLKKTDSPKSIVSRGEKFEDVVGILTMLRLKFCALWETSILGSEDGVAPDKPLDLTVLSRLTLFSAMNKLKRMALRVITSKLLEEEIADLKQMFEMIDTDNSGYITFEELKAGLKRFGSTLTESEIYDRSHAIYGSGYITLDELQQACKEFRLDDVHLEEIIKEADQNN
nr:hypothetical protein [Tanacetum cinerariifolium]